MLKWLIIGILIVLIVSAAFRTIRKFTRGGGCCGEHEAAVKKSGAADRRKDHYSWQVSMEIGGMTCENCARRVENALNAMEGVWAQVSISTHTAKVRLKQEPDRNALKETVRKAGYTVTGWK